MKKLLVLILSVAGIATARSYDYPYLTFQNVDGSEKSVSVESLVITYVNNQLVVCGDGVNQNFDVSQLSKMFFASETSGIESLNIANDGSVEIYDMFGIYLGTYQSKQHALSSLEKGFYVMKSACGTSKIVVQ